jgi:hypothetical protein
LLCETTKKVAENIVSKVTKTFFIKYCYKIKKTSTNLDFVVVFC